MQIPSTINSSPLNDTTEVLDVVNEFGIWEEFRLRSLLLPKLDTKRTLYISDYIMQHDGIIIVACSIVHAAGSVLA